MCGRYVLGRELDELVGEFGVEQVRVEEALAPDYNIAPTKPVYAVLERPLEPEGPPVRQLRVVRWGLVPSWAEDPSVGNRMVNARSETVATKPAYRRAFAARRCLLPADGYYEWAVLDTDPDLPKSKVRKQPYFVSRADGELLAMAGLYEWWRDTTRPEDDPDAWLWTCTVITTEAEPDIGLVHERMPLLVEPDRYDEWLDPAPLSPADLTDLLVPATPGQLATRPVSSAVNSVRNNSVELTAAVAVPTDGDGTLF